MTSPARRSIPTSVTMCFREADAAENKRVDHLSAFVQNEYVGGVYEIIEVIDE